ncbi:unnamed protein product [Paramecium octaurelia]|uniref:TATA box binding protein associated factor (TAF) histone-like fold domain-containing protein n=1 Tax=Paramecium octaurelia TaxID=43137 RepID=A0A8S1TY87_PAROT|nr:unnamed protein product [Paramecium octaurelia]
MNQQEHLESQYLQQIILFFKVFDNADSHISQVQIHIRIHLTQLEQPGFIECWTYKQHVRSQALFGKELMRNTGSEIRTRWNGKFNWSILIGKGQNPRDHYQKRCFILRRKRFESKKREKMIYTNLFRRGCRSYFNIFFNVNIKLTKFVFSSMSVYRDESILKGLLQGKTIEQGAELHLFILVEQNVRKIIQEAIKYQRHFRKKQLNSQDIELAIKDQNMQKSEIFGFQYMDSINLSKRMDEYVLNDQSLDLRDLISHQMRTVKIPLGFPSLSIFNVMKDYQMINSQETQSIMQYKDIIQTESFQSMENKKSFNIIKDNVISILTVHQQSIVKNFKDLFEKEVISLKFNFSQEFVQLLSDLESYKDVAQIVPFIVQYLYSQQDQVQLFYYKHRCVIIECLSRLIINNQINLEFQLHQIIKILVKFLTAKIIEINLKFQIELQIKTARCLNYLLDKFNLKYQALRQNVDGVILNKFDRVTSKIEKKNSHKSLLKAYSIIQYFIEQNVCVQHLKFVEQVSELMRKIDQGRQSITQHNPDYEHLAGLISLSLGSILIKIINGLQYLQPNHENQILHIINNTRQLMLELGLYEMLVMQQHVVEHMIL